MWRLWHLVKYYDEPGLILGTYILSDPCFYYHYYLLMSMCFVSSTFISNNQQ